MRYLAVNAATFNVADSVIVRNARVLVETILRFIRYRIIYFSTRDDSAFATTIHFSTSTQTNIVQLYHEISELPDSELIEWRRRKAHSEFADDSAASSGLNAAPWMVECENVMSAVMAHEAATHFLNQENPVCYV